MYLGIDTSCYTTSVALMNDYGILLADRRTILTVPLGKNGLRQSEMVFQHNKNISNIFMQLKERFQDTAMVIKGIAVSSKPRSDEDSYMPAFTVGTGYAQTLAAVLNVPLYCISHQENHLWSALWSIKKLTLKNFLFLHISGGTTELLKVCIRRNPVELHKIIETLDLSVGQFVDRVGVSMGLSFPAGEMLSQKAVKGHVTPVELPLAYNKKGFFSFSGVESQVQRLIVRGVDNDKLAAGVEICIAKSILLAILSAAKDTKCNDIILAGGVSANKFLRVFLQENLINKINVYFPEPAFSSDNAAGAAFLAQQQQQNSSGVY